MALKTDGTNGQGGERDLVRRREMCRVTEWGGRRGWQPDKAVHTLLTHTHPRGHTTPCMKTSERLGKMSEREDKQKLDKKCEACFKTIAW